MVVFSVFGVASLVDLEDVINLSNFQENSLDEHMLETINRPLMILGHLDMLAQELILIFQILDWWTQFFFASYSIFKLNKPQLTDLRMYLESWRYMTVFSPSRVVNGVIYWSKLGSPL